MIVIVVGVLAATLTIASFLPQAWKIVKTRETKGLSTSMWALNTVGFAMWIGYGVMLRKLPIIVPNAICLVLAGFILVIAVRSRSDNSNREAKPADRARR
jgi:MtN3 and saliva related transmembrane protein